MTPRLSKITRAVFFTAIALDASHSYGGPEEDAIAREVALKSAESYAKEKVANYLNQQVASTLPAGAGSSVFATIDLGSAIYDFSRAETDKQKAYAGSRAAIAGYALLAGPAAPILAAALLIASVLESSMAARHQAEMLKIYKLIQEQYTRIIEIETLLLNADFIQFRHLVAVATGALAEYETYINEYKKSCSTEGLITDLAKLDSCVMSISRAMAAAKLFVDTADSIEDWKLRESDLVTRLANAAAINLDDLITARSSARKLISDIGPKVDEMYGLFAKYAAELTVTQALNKPAFSTVEWVHLNCIDQAVGHSRSGTDLVLSARSLSERVRRTQFRAYIRGVDSYRTSLCNELGGLPDSVFKPALTMWNDMVSTTRAQVMKVAQ